MPLTRSFIMFRFILENNHPTAALSNLPANNGDTLHAEESDSSAWSAFRRAIVSIIRATVNTNDGRTTEDDSFTQDSLRAPHSVLPYPVTQFPLTHSTPLSRLYPHLTLFIHLHLLFRLPLRHNLSSTRLQPFRSSGFVCTFAWNSPGIIASYIHHQFLTPVDGYE